MKPTKTGFLKFRQYQTYYEVYGEPSQSKYPLLVIHGGPGSSHNYLLGLSDLAHLGRQVIFYDQIGCGLSDSSLDDALWNIPTYLEELSTVRTALGLRDIHLLGHSWGGMLAIEYLLSRPPGVHSATLASAMISMPMYQREVEKLKKDLPPRTYATMIANEATGTTDSAEYARAYKVYKSRHIFRGKSLPQHLQGPSNPSSNAAYLKLWGPSEAWASGSLKSWDRVSRLHEITAPTLITSGQYDELTPNQAEVTRVNIPNSELEIFTAGSHLTHVEFRDEYVNRIHEFLRGKD